MFGFPPLKVPPLVAAVVTETSLAAWAAAREMAKRQARRMGRDSMVRRARCGRSWEELGGMPASRVGGAHWGIAGDLLVSLHPVGN